MRRLARSVVASGLLSAAVADVLAQGAREAPPFPSVKQEHWIGEPRTWGQLRGRVVLLDVWTFDCVNCLRTLPWIRTVRERYARQGLVVVGVHTPEFDHERPRDAVEAAVRSRGLDFAHFLDNDYAYWRALGNHYWPTTYLVDRCGRIRARHIGEVHAEQRSGRALEAKIESLLAEASEACS
jgi:thiol-disulfide isomerase/thioredoxin